MVTDAVMSVLRWQAQGVTVARVEVITDEHRCGIDPLNRFTLAAAAYAACRSSVRPFRTPGRNADPHSTMDSPPADKSSVK